MLISKFSNIAKGKGNNITDGLRKMWQEEIDKYSDIIQEEVLIEKRIKTL